MPEDPAETAAWEYAKGASVDDVSAPHAEVEQVGRWSYLVSVHERLTIWGPYGIGWRVLGHRRARRKAEKVLLEYVEAQRRRTAVERVRLADD